MILAKYVMSTVIVVSPELDSAHTIDVADENCRPMTATGLSVYISYAKSSIQNEITQF